MLGGGQTPPRASEKPPSYGASRGDLVVVTWVDAAFYLEGGEDAMLLETAGWFMGRETSGRTPTIRIASERSAGDMSLTDARSVTVIPEVLVTDFTYLRVDT